MNLDKSNLSHTFANNTLIISVIISNSIIIMLSKIKNFDKYQKFLYYVINFIYFFFYVTVYKAKGVHSDGGHNQSWAGQNQSHKWRRCCKFERLQDQLNSEFYLSIGPLNKICCYPYLLSDLNLCIFYLIVFFTNK